MEQVANNLWSFPVVLPENPLKWLNCYVIKNPGGRNLLVDTGFKRPECLDALLGGMRELDIRPEETDVFLTHLHSDHTGNADTLHELGCRIMMSRIDWTIMNHKSWDVRERRMLAEGMPETVLRDVKAHNPAVLYAPGPFPAELREDGDLLRCGDYTFRCVLAPGHTPGHMCLYDEEKGIMLLGDHILFDITPNITCWTEVEDSLGNYLDSLHDFQKYEIKLALPAHRHLGSCTTAERIRALEAHHAARLAETERIIRDHPGINAYDTAGLMTWKIRSRNWAEFPPGQKWFAVGEAMTHLDYLALRGRISRRTAADGTVTYVINED